MNLINNAFYIAWDNQYNHVAMVQWGEDDGGWRIMYHDYTVAKEVFTPIYMALDPSDFENVKNKDDANKRMWRLIAQEHGGT